MTVRGVLQKAFDDLFVAEARINELYINGETNEDEMNAIPKKWASCRDDSHDFIFLMPKLTAARALGVAAFGMDSDVSELRCNVQKCYKLLLENQTFYYSTTTNYFWTQNISNG